ncbi:Hypothetical protein ETEE_0992 [Edwardsiella anguillarum ET080813]|uniref:Uncharacterized protein n=1 Tax=Edwardsiella anguillarum ET080813 TaxID=667120 RepID=A0A076LL14_9GAMM|nr:Hypothetical protein ETEE_0992 [Edwardsiella anguillarum ET080813]
MFHIFLLIFHCITGLCITLISLNVSEAIHDARLRKVFCNFCF